MDINAILVELQTRLPELEWKVSALGGALSTKSLPRGLFQSRFEMSAVACVDEIKSDIQALALQRNKYSANYLAKRIHQKINILVTLCHRQAKKQQVEDKKYFGVSMISTRQQWLQSLERDITMLSEQKKSNS